MDEKAYAFLKRLLETPSPSGYEAPVQAVVREYVAPFADSIEVDYHGNLIAAVNPEGSPRILYAGHCDQIGFLVQHIDDNGLIAFDGIGGHDVAVLIGQAVTVWTANGPVPGVIARKAIHVLEGDERDRVPKMHTLWIDIGARDKEDAAGQVQIGDPVTFDLQVRELRNDRIAAPGLDDKVGTWAVMEALRRVAGRREELQAAVFAVSTVQEEIGLRGARTATHRVDPQVGVAVDVTHATDTPGMDPKRHGEVKLGGGAVITRGPNINPRVFELFCRVAREKGIPHQIAAEARATGTDANAIQISRSGVAAGLLSVPNRYMHSPVEVIQRSDLEAVAQLFTEFALAATPETDWTP